jgi:hypothetical protein
LIDTIAREQLEKNQQQDMDIVRVCGDSIVEEYAPNIKESCNSVTDTGLDLQQKVTVTDDTFVLLKAPATPVVSKEIVCMGYHQNAYERSYGSVLCNKDWPSILVVTEVGHEYDPTPVVSPAYTVQSPEEESGDKTSIKAVDNNSEELEDGRRSMRNQQQKMEKVMDQAAAISKKRNLEGNPSSDENLLPGNALSILSNTEIMRRASLMGVDIPSDNFEFVDLLKELETSRKNLGDKLTSNKALVVQHDGATVTPLNMTWYDSEDQMIDDSFTMV